jgi:hypothetical protein
VDRPKPKATVTKTVTNCIPTLALAVVLAGTAVAWAQHPSFAGTWNLREPKEGRGKPVGGADGPLASGGQDGFHPVLVVRQTASELVVEGRSYHQNPDVKTISLDGTETSADTPAGKVTSKAAWEAGSLVVNSKRTFGSPMGDITVETKDIYSLVSGMLNLERDETTMSGTTRKLAVYIKGG